MSSSSGGSSKLHAQGMVLEASKRAKVPGLLMARLVNLIVEVVVTGKSEGCYAACTGTAPSWSHACHCLQVVEHTSCSSRTLAASKALRCCGTPRCGNACLAAAPSPVVTSAVEPCAAG